MEFLKIDQTINIEPSLIAIHSVTDLFFCLLNVRTTNRNSLLVFVFFFFLEYLNGNIGVRIDYDFNLIIYFAHYFKLDTIPQKYLNTQNTEHSKP